MADTKEILHLNKLQANEKGEVIIVHREDETPVVHKLHNVGIEGTIGAVNAWLSERGKLETPQHPVERSHIVYSYKGLYIKFVGNENHPLKDVITGKLVINKDIEWLCINNGAKFDSKKLSKHLRENRYFFADKDEHRVVVEKLQAFKAKVTTDIEKIQNTNTGDRRDLYEVAVSGNQPPAFNVKMSLFIGQPAQTFKVEIMCEAHANGVDFYLDSVDLREILQEQAISIINDEVALMREKGYVIIEQQ